MNNLIVIGAVAVGGYLLFQFLSNEQLSLQTSLAANSSPTPTQNVASTNPYAKYYITPTLANQLQQYVQIHWGTLNNTNFDGWNYAYEQMTGTLIPWSGASVNQNTNFTISAQQWAQIINTQVTGAVQTLTGLGHIGRTGNIGYQLQNRNLPKNLELFNAMVR